MTAWKIAMMAALVFGMLAPTGRLARLRVWAAMMGGVLIASAYPSIWVYIAIDTLVATIILLPPKSNWQRMIALCYVAMILVMAGYMIAQLQIFSSATGSPDMLKAVLDGIGWLAVGILFVWGGDDLAGVYWPSNGTASSASLASRRSG